MTRTTSNQLQITLNQDITSQANTSHYTSTSKNYSHDTTVSHAYNATLTGRALAVARRCAKRARRWNQVDFRRTLSNSRAVCSLLGKCPMKFADIEGNNRVEAQPGLTGKCRDCGQPMVAKCGQHVALGALEVQSLRSLVGARDGMASVVEGPISRRVARDRTHCAKRRKASSRRENGEWIGPRVSVLAVERRRAGLTRGILH